MTEVERLRQQLLEQQKLASLGLLSAGIAHEIQNPLNFVVNFSKMSEKLVADLTDIVSGIEDKLDPDDALDIQEISEDLVSNMKKIQEHGERAVSIIQGILLISRGKEGEKLPTDVAHLAHEYLWLAYHAQRANDKSFNISIKENFQPNMPKVLVIPQDLSRAILNVVNNACYAVKDRAQAEQAIGVLYQPTIAIGASIEDGKLEIIISDNGTGMPEEVRQKLFKETITTKPLGQGTGLGMQITHKIIVEAHHGEILIDTKMGEGTTFKFIIPVETV